MRNGNDMRTGREGKTAGDTPRSRSERAQSGATGGKIASLFEKAKSSVAGGVSSVKDSFASMRASRSRGASQPQDSAPSRTSPTISDSFEDMPAEQPAAVSRKKAATEDVVKSAAAQPAQERGFVERKTGFKRRTPVSQIEDISDEEFDAQFVPRGKSSHAGPWRGEVVELPDESEQGVQQRTEKSKDDIYYVPNVDIPSSGRPRYKRRNRKPWKMWQKATLTGTCIALVFFTAFGTALSAVIELQMNSSIVSTGGTGNMQDFYTIDGENGDTVINLTQEDIDAINKLDEEHFEFPDTPIKSDKDIMNILVIGSDSRTGIGSTARSDAMMIVTLDKKHKKIKMVSVLRDLYVKIPGYRGSRINASFSYGGVELLKETLETNLRVEFDHYVIVDFSAFKTIVDAVDGVDITITDAEAKYLRTNKISKFPRFTAGGTYKMSGAEALMYARIRKVDSDFGRTNRQRTVLRAIVEKCKTRSYGELATIMYNMFAYISTDFTQAELLGVLVDATEIMNYEMKSLTVPIDGSWEYGDVAGMSVIISNLTFNAESIQAFIYDDDMQYTDGGKASGVKIPDISSISPTKATTSATGAVSASDATTPAATSSTSASATASTTASTTAPTTTTTATTTTTTAAATTTTTTTVASSQENAA